MFNWALTIRFPVVLARVPLVCLGRYERFGSRVPNEGFPSSTVKWTQETGQVAKRESCS